MLGRIALVGALPGCALLHSVCDFKTTLVNMKHSLIQEFYKFKLGYNAVKAAKNIYCVKSEGGFDHNNQMVQEILLGLQECQ